MTTKYDALFSGIIGEEYNMLNLTCPLAIKMSHLVGESLKDYVATKTEKLNVVELGGGTGITTLALLNASENMHLLSVDNEPVMQNQAKEHLNAWVESGQLTFSENDALSALQNLPDASVDVVASAYTLHNFLNTYRADVIRESFRVLKSGGQFVNGDRYALNDISQHTRIIQDEIAGCFRALTAENKLDLLEHWVIHVLSDESENHIMREAVALQELHDAGFSEVNLTHRITLNALVTAIKT
jgi:ubiquinone/menaquinone biosynthesis C-methylase UbiE